MLAIYEEKHFSITLRTKLKLTCSPWITTSGPSSSVLRLTVEKWLKRMWGDILEHFNTTIAAKHRDSSKSPEAWQNSPMPHVLPQRVNKKMTRNDSQRLDMFMYLGLRTHPCPLPFFFLFFFSFFFKSVTSTIPVSTIYVISLSVMAISLFAGPVGINFI